jgi:hypothetical protein
MFIRCDDTTQPGILVEEGSTFTLSAQDSPEFPTLLANLRPRTTAALLTVAGRPPAKPVRLSDGSEFEHVRRKEGLVDLYAIDAEERVGGYSLAFLSRIFDVLDPESRMPPAMVEFRARARRDKISGCGCHKEQVAAASEDAHASSRALGTQEIRNQIAARVPKFISDLDVRVLAPYVSDIIVKPNATLVLDGSVRNLIARNVFCYTGSRIVQKSGRCNVDVTGVLRGSIPNYVIFYTAADVLKIRALDLQQIAAVNP